MTGRLNLAQLRRRVDALEEGRQAGPLSSAEARELTQIEADFDRAFPGLRESPEVLNTWPLEMIECFIQYECGPADGPAARFHELRKRARTLEQIEADRIHGEMIDAMSDAELEKWINDRIHGPKGPPSWNR